MSEFDGFKRCKKIGERWDDALEEFVESGERLVCKEFDTDTDAKRIALAFCEVVQNFNDRMYDTRRIKAIKEGLSVFIFPTVNVRSVDNTVYLQRDERFACKKENSKGESTFSTSCFAWIDCEVIA